MRCLKPFEEWSAGGASHFPVEKTGRLNSGGAVEMLSTADFPVEKTGRLDSGGAVEMLSTADFSVEKVGRLDSGGAVKILSSADTISRNDASGFDDDGEPFFGLDVGPSWPPKTALDNDANLRASSWAR